MGFGIGDFVRALSPIGPASLVTKAIGGDVNKYANVLMSGLPSGGIANALETVPDAYRQGGIAQAADAVIAAPVGGQPFFDSMLRGAGRALGPDVMGVADVVVPTIASIYAPWAGAAAKGVTGKMKAGAEDREYNYGKGFLDAAIVAGAGYLGQAAGGGSAAEGGSEVGGADSIMYTSSAEGGGAGAGASAGAIGTKDWMDIAGAIGKGVGKVASGTPQAPSGGGAVRAPSPPPQMPTEEEALTQPPPSYQESSSLGGLGGGLSKASGSPNLLHKLFEGEDDEENMTLAEYFFY